MSIESVAEEDNEVRQRERNGHIEYARINVGELAEFSFILDIQGVHHHYDNGKNGNADVLGRHSEGLDEEEKQEKNLT